MSLGKKLAIRIAVLFLLASPTIAVSVPDGARAVQVSGGENHTLVLTAGKTVWACGDNSWYQLGIGNNTPQGTLAQVLKGDMDSPTLYLACIDAVDAGWKHSLALDVNGFVWAWGNNTFYPIKTGDGNFLQKCSIFLYFRASHSSFIVEQPG